MAVQAFKPDIWSSVLVQHLLPTSVATAITNRDYEQDAELGAKAVRLTSFVRPAVVPYQPYTDFEWQEVQDQSQILHLDQQNTTNQELDDVDYAQAANGGMVLQEAVRAMGEELAIELDRDVLNVMGIAGTDAGAATLTLPEEAYNLLAQQYVALDKANVPADRFAVVSPQLYGLLMRDERFVATGDEAAAMTRTTGVVGGPTRRAQPLIASTFGFGTPDERAALLTATRPQRSAPAATPPHQQVGHAAGFTIHKSNQLRPGTEGLWCLFGHRRATTLAEQLDTLEAVSLPNRFTDAVKALHSYGRLVVQPPALRRMDVGVA